MPTSQSVVHSGNNELITSTPIGSLAQSSMFWQPDYLQPSAWLEHLPALFWLVEALQPSRCMTLGVQQGAAHFAVCQAVSRLRLDARCYGVQSRAGLSEAGIAEYDTVKDYHARHYGTISQLLDTSPEEALAQLATASLDLLVVNLPVDTADMDTLLDKAVTQLSSRGVIVLPGIERREPGARLHDVFERLAEQYSAFRFAHGDGMGIVAVGAALPSRLHMLLEANEHPGTKRVLGDVFQRLGRSCADAVESQEARQRALQLARELERLTRDHEQRGAELAATRQQLGEQSYSHAREQGQLEARVAMLQEMRAEERSEPERHHQPSAVSREDKAERAALESRVSELTAERDDVQASLDARFQELAQLTRQLEQQRQTLEQVEAKRNQAQKENQTLEQRLKQSEAARQKATQALEKTEAKLQAAEQALTDARYSVQERFQELATLTGLLEESEQARETLVSKVQLLESAPANLPSASVVKAEHIASAPAPSSSSGASSAFGGSAKPQDSEKQKTAAPAPMQEGKKSEDDASMVNLPDAIYRKDPQRLRQDVELLKKSELFDAEWYLNRYPDIAKHKRFSQRPERHYLRFGGFEGRNPGPEFDSRFYLKRYADARESGLNPLVHYLRYGQQEQRQVRKK